MLKLTIDGKEARVRPGVTIYWAAKSLGITESAYKVRLSRARKKVADYLQAGTRMVWLVSPRARTIEVWRLEPSLLDAVAAHVGDRGARLELTVTEGQLFIGIGGETVTGALERLSLA